MLTGMANGILGSLSLGLIWSFLAIGVFITFRVLDFADLSVDGTLALGAAVFAYLVTTNHDPFLSILLAFCAGLLGGLVTALLHTLLKIPPLLSGILTMTALYSVTLRVLNGANLSIHGQETILTFFRRVTHIPQSIQLSDDINFGNFDALVLTVILVVVIAVILYIFFGTEIGYALRATGSNPQMIRAQGVNTNTMKIIGLMLSNGLAAFSGALLVQNQGFATVTMGAGSIVIGLASVIIGEVLFGTRSFKNSLISIILGSVIYRVVIAVVLELGMEPNDTKLLTAAIIALALALPLVKNGLLKLKKPLTGNHG